MKPIKLIMSAFGSYADTTEVDFRDVDHGIFLITGDTGAGKTTIFDAIVYALYDRASGGAREATDMRSQYADSETPTYVEFTFSYGEDVYTIRRNPRYTRLSKRRDKNGNYKETEEAPQVSLIMPGGREFVGKIRETNEKIIEIIGLDADQFTQIAMIAQGEFMKLLQASSNQRREIFAKIFNTKIYARIQEQLRSQTKALYVKLEDNRRYCEVELQGVRGLEEGEELVFGELNAESNLERIKVLAKEGKQKEKESRQSLEVLEKELEQLNRAMTEGRQVNELFSAFHHALEERDELQACKQAQDEKAVMLERAKKALEVAPVALKRQADYAALEETKRRLMSLEKQCEELVVVIREKEEAKQEAQKLLQEQQPLLQEQMTLIKNTLSSYEKAEEVAGQLRKLEEEIDLQKKACARLELSLEDKKKKLYAQNEQASLLLTEYQHANDTFIAEQAGVMAETLEEGMPCPVCGSTSHPHKAMFTEGAISQSDVETSKAKWQKAVQLVEKLSGEVEAEKETLLTENAKENESRLQAETVKTQYVLLKEQLTYESKEKAQAAVDVLAKELYQVEKTLEVARQAWEQACEKLAKAQTQKKAEEEQIERLEKQILEDTKEYELLLEKQGFAKEEDYLAAVKKEEERSALEKEVTEYQNRVVMNQTSIEHYEQQTKGKSPVEIDRIEEALQSKKQDKSDLENMVVYLHGHNERNQEILDKLKKLYNYRKELKAQYDLYSNLDKTANGNLSGTAKMDFQTFIQRKYFEKIIHEANKRLVKMTSNQFILQCRDLQNLGSQGAVGLDLDVYSLVNDKTRDVKTLSGGESFMAALSMALGMADVIQKAAGKVRLDTMFVDEGFGSLDDESRAEAIRILQELAGGKRLVGIISHVTELKEQIDRKLIVRKDEKGSKIQWKH